MFGIKGGKASVDNLPAPASGLYDWASFEDRLAERAMVVFMEHAKLQPGSLDMEFDKVAKGAYRMAKTMLKARAGK